MFKYIAEVPHYSNHRQYIKTALYTVYEPVLYNPNLQAS